MSANLYQDHVASLQNETAAILDELGLDSVVISSGMPLRYFEDDQDAPFRPSPHFAHWLPLTGPDHLLWIRPTQKPMLMRVSPNDYWYEPVRRDLPFWADCYEIQDVSSAAEAWQRIQAGSDTAYIGDNPASALEAGIAEQHAHPESLVSRLHWMRSYKTAYEINCIDLATAKAKNGHMAAKQAFEAGQSELDIHFAFVRGVGCPEHELPYSTIVALDDKGAILHYTSKRPNAAGNVLLIDSGASHHGYACDITRTWTRPGAPDQFREMVSQFDVLQQQLCDEVKPGLPYGDLHHLAHQMIAGLLVDMGILKGDTESAVSDGLTTAFFPHGLGHFLGLQVHDVAGHQAAPAGGNNPPPKAHPFLRTTRTIETGQVFTVEPGLYFIEMLLEPLRNGPHKNRFDWSLIEQLTPCGGIRIEDNVVVTDAGHRNLTREHF